MPEAEALARFVAQLARIRHEHPVLRCRHFLHGTDEPAPGILDIAWFDTHGDIIVPESWNNPEKRLFAVRRAWKNGDGTTPILTLFLNPSDQNRVFRLPTQNVPTRLLIDTAQPDMDERDISSEEIRVVAHSAILTKSVLRPFQS
jgi:glycogen operon protein